MSYTDKANQLVNQFVNIVKVKELNEEDTQAAIGYAFGVLNGLAYEMDVEPMKVQTAMLAILMRDFEMELKPASEFTQFLIEATDETYHPTFFKIINLGIDGYYDLIANEDKLVKEQFENIQISIKDAQDNEKL